MWTERCVSANAGRRRRASALTNVALGLNGAPGKGPKPSSKTRTTSLPKQVGDFLDRGIGCEPSRCHRGFDALQCGLERPIGAQGSEQPLFQHFPHPFHLLLAAPCSELTRRRELLPMLECLFPK